MEHSIASRTAFAVCLILSLALGCCPPTHASVTEDVVVVKRHDMYFGETVAYLGEGGAKCLMPTYHLALFAKAPDWHIVGINQLDNIAFEVPFDEWKRRGMKHVGDLRFFTDSNPQKVYYKRLKLNAVSLRQAAKNPMGGIIAEGFYQSKMPSQAIKMKELIYTDDVKLSPNAVAFVQGLFRTPRNAKVPLEYNWYDAKGKKFCNWWTESIETKKMSPNIFAYPKGYKLTKNSDDVIAGSDRRKEVGGIIGDLLGEDKPAARRSGASHAP